MKSPVERVLAKLGLPTLLELLSSRVSGADLTSLLLETMRRRAANVQPADLLERYTHDRFVAPPTTSWSALRRVEDAITAACGDYEVIALAPLVPLATHSAIATVDQNKVVTTIRNSEVAADPTNALALEAAARRAAALRADPKSNAIVRLGASQRVVRAQLVSGPRHFAHFQLFGLVCASRDTGGRAFDARAAAEQLTIHARALIALEADEIRIALTDFSGGEWAAVSTAVRNAIAPLPRATCVDDPERASGRGYYQGFCFKVHVRFGDDAFEVADGGVVDWTQRLVGSAKERCFISGIGIERLAHARP